MTLPRSGNATARSSGFTLLEMLIAMTLLAVMLSLLYGSLRLSARSWDAGEKRAVENAQMALVQGFLRRQLSQATAFRWKQQVTAGIAFSGQRERLRFVAPMAVKAGLGGLYLVSLERRKEKTNDTQQFILQHVALQASSSSFAELEKAAVNVLADQIESIEFSYFGAETPQGEPKWLERWEQPARMPLLIRLRVSFANQRNWPELIVAPLIGPESGCLWNSQGNLCSNI